jgi:hypothetical protein
MAELEFSALARQWLDQRIASIEELAAQVQDWAAERNRPAVKIHWSFTVKSAEDKMKHWYEKVNPANKTTSSAEPVLEVKWPKH